VLGLDRTLETTVSWILVSHSDADRREAAALKQWLGGQDPPLAHEIFLDQGGTTGIASGARWKEELFRADSRCQGVICLLSRRWESCPECAADYRTAENLGKQIFVARLEPTSGNGINPAWPRCDLFGGGRSTLVGIGDGSPVMLASEGLYRLRDGIRGVGNGAESFIWPPPGQPERAPYRGWAPYTEVDAGVFFGRDAQIGRALNALRAMRQSAGTAVFVVAGPSGSGKSSFLRAGLLPRLRSDDGHFVLLDVVRPQRHPLTGDTGLAHAVHGGRRRLGLVQPTLGEIKTICARGDVAQLRALLVEVRRVAAARLPHPGAGRALPTVVLPLDQAEELFTDDAGEQASAFLRLLGQLVEPDADAAGLGLIVVATIAADDYPTMRAAPELAALESLLFEDLTPISATQITDIITGPVARSTEAGRALHIDAALVDRLLADAAAATDRGGDTLALLALTLSRLHTDHGSSGMLTLAHYQQIGGLRRVVNTEIDEILSANPTERANQLEQLRAAFIPWLATAEPSNNQPARRVARWSELPEATRPLIDALVAKRLLVKERRAGNDGAERGGLGEIVVEIGQESMLRQWDDLAAWLRERHHNLATAEELQRRAADWEADNHNPSRLLSGTHLIDAETVADTTEFRGRLAHTSDYLAASRRTENIRLETENQRHRAELAAAKNELAAAKNELAASQQRQAAAEALAAAQTEARSQAQELAFVLAKRFRLLKAALVGVSVIVVVALIAVLVAVLV
jgi:hypothetical protein